MDGNNHPWKIILTYSNFYKELVDLWIRVSYQEPSNVTEICNQALWNNMFIAPQGKPLGSLFSTAFLLLELF